MAEAKAKAAENKSEKSFDFSKTLKDTFGTLKAVFTNPTKTTDKVRDFKDAKTTGIFAGFSIVMYIIISLIASIFQVVVQKSCNYFTGKCETKVNFENLNGFDFFKTLGNSFLYIAGAIAVIAVVVYIIGLVFKKQPNFFRLVAIATAGYAPIIVSTLLSVLVGYVWSALSTFVLVCGFALATAFMVTAHDKEIALENDKKIYFHVAVATVTFIVAYFIITNVMKDSLSLLNLL